MNSRKSSVWIIIMSAMWMLGTEATAYADTYNFFFGQKKKKTDTEEVQADSEKAAEEAVSTNSEEKSEESHESTQNQTQDTKRISVSPQTPIIINNINNNDNTNRNQMGAANLPKPAEVPSATPASSPTTASTEPSVAASITPYPYDRPRNNLDFGLSATYLSMQASGVVIDTAQQTGMLLGETGAGLVATVGQHRDALGWDVQLGVYRTFNTYAVRPYLGAELEFMPFRIAFSDRWDLLRAGFVAGVGTLGAVPGNEFALNAGVRATLHLGESFGLTGTIRGNFGYAQAEVGLVGSI